MDDIIKVIRIACYNLKKTFTSSKIYIIIILSFMYIQFMLNPVKVFAENVQIGVSSYLFPFINIKLFCENISASSDSTVLQCSIYG